MITLTGDFTPLMKKAAKVTYELLELSGRPSIEVIEADKDTIKQTNKETRNIDSVTDVLSFPMITEVKPFIKKNYFYEYNPDTRTVEIGSIMICSERAAEQAEEYGHSLDREMTYLFVHGLLHILGYDHIEEEDKKTMRQKEELIMSELKLEREEA